jgi:hypothetical protein
MWIMKVIHDQDTPIDSPNEMVHTSRFVWAMQTQNQQIRGYED